MSAPTVAEVRASRWGVGNPWLDTAQGAGVLLADAAVTDLINVSMDVIAGIKNLDRYMDGFDDAEKRAVYRLVHEQTMNPTNSSSVNVGGKSQNYKGYEAVALETLRRFTRGKTLIARGKYTNVR